MSAFMKKKKPAPAPAAVVKKSWDMNEQAAKVVTALNSIIQKVQSGGITFMSVMSMMVDVLDAAPVYEYVQSLDAPTRNKFWGACFDKAIGTDSTAIVTQVGPFKGDALEQMTDGMKAAFVTLMNQRYEQAA